MGTKAIASPIPASFAVSDMDRLLLDLNSAFNPLHTACQVDFHVSAVKDGYVFMSIALPEGMTRAYVTLLESLNGLIRCMDVKSRAVASQSRVTDLTMLEETRRRVEAVKAKAISTYDRLIADGCGQSEAISRTNADLKAGGEVLATYEWVKGVLRSAGKFRKRR